MSESRGGTYSRHAYARGAMIRACVCALLWRAGVSAGLLVLAAVAAWPRLTLPFGLRGK